MSETGVYDFFRSMISSAKVKKEVARTHKEDPCADYSWLLTYNAMRERNHLLLFKALARMPEGRQG